MPLRLALFAADTVGAAIVDLFVRRGVQPAVVVLDSQDPRGINEQLAATSGADTVIPSNELATPGGIEKLRAAGCDLGILAWWPYLIRSPLLEVPRMGYLNFHPSLLPHNRGKHPNFWSLVEGTPYGVTLHFINAGIDSGDIAWQQAIPTGWEDTGGTLHQKGRDALVELFTRHFDDIVAGRIPRRAQDPGAGTFHLGKELDPASRIDLTGTYTGRALLNLLRARTYPPHPAAWFEDGLDRYEVRVEIRKIR